MNKGNLFPTLKLYFVSRCLAERSALALSKALSQALESPSRLGRLEARKQESDCILIYLTHSIAQEARKPEGWKAGKLRKLESL